MKSVAGLENIILRGKEYLRSGGDDKVFVYEGEMRILLIADSRVIKFNGLQIGNRYITEVECRGIVFVTVTVEPIGFGRFVS
ncbi:MAG TPA: hypothetical protein VNG29_03165 [Candidatus Paceibacterota bacterium]|nr:hypothetical protein [Candidatus Paceibacterota bacterium]